jgi:hypothetical protein
MKESHVRELWSPDHNRRNQSATFQTSFIEGRDDDGSLSDGEQSKLRASYLAHALECCNCDVRAPVAKVVHMVWLLFNLYGYRNTDSTASEP